MSSGIGWKPIFSVAVMISVRFLNGMQENTKLEFEVDPPYPRAAEVLNQPGVRFDRFAVGGSPPGSAAPPPCANDMTPDFMMKLWTIRSSAYAYE